eukprot:16622-Heterococcus_DN1.PRE.1
MHADAPRLYPVVYRLSAKDALRNALGSAGVAQCSTAVVAVFAAVINAIAPNAILSLLLATVALLQGAGASSSSGAAASLFKSQGASPSEPLWVALYEQSWKQQ